MLFGVAYGVLIVGTHGVLIVGTLLHQFHVLPLPSKDPFRLTAWVVQFASLACAVSPIRCTSVCDTWSDRRIAEVRT